jgi:glycosyltransferase involved in cell wall biosynthesis
MKADSAVRGAVTNARRRLLLLTEIISPYRIPVFNALARHAAIDLHVIFLAETDPTQRQWLVYKNEIQFPYQILPSWRRRLGKYHLLLNRGLRSALRQASPEVILCGGYNYPAAWELLWWAHRKHLPFMVWVESTARDQRGGHFLVELLKSKFMGSCNGFVVAGKSSREYVKALGAPEEHIFTAPDAVDTDFFSQRAKGARADGGMRLALHVPARFFLYVGRLVREKGVFDLLEAYRALAPDLRLQVGLVFVGDGPARKELQQLAGAIAPGRVTFAGFVHREQLAAYYALADVFVFPTHTDPWGLVVNEAMACALPVISTGAAGCVEDLVEDHWNGRVLPAGDVGRLASAMNELAASAELRLLMGQRSWDRIQKYSPEMCAAGIAEAALTCGGPRSA